MEITIKSKEGDDTDYLQIISDKLNERFTTQEQMEMRIDVFLVEIAMELGCIFDVEQNLFDFTQEWKGYC